MDKQVETPGRIRATRSNLLWNSRLGLEQSHNQEAWLLIHPRTRRRSRIEGHRRIEEGLASGGYT
jgi:hypothetical protein